MKVWKLCLFFFLRLSSTLGEDTVAEDIGVHQLERLVEMLTSQECKDLLFALSHPEENIVQHLERLSPEKNQLDLKRAKRDSSAAADSEEWCRTALTAWMLRFGKQTYYDRLSRALQHIGRTDIAIGEKQMETERTLVPPVALNNSVWCYKEVGKNINQEKALNLKRYVEEYHKYVNSLNFPLEQPDTKEKPREGQTLRKRRVRDLTWRDLDLIVERAPVALYQKGPLDVALPLLYGILLGFGGTLLTGVAILLVIIHVSSGNQQSRHPRVTRSNLRVGDAVLEDAASGIIENISSLGV
ncbi:transmembrane and death domain protein 1-like isoform X1 [Sebastes umbrosus]|uniref:transmembrane and death domain protein 1-like isoform X1 n=1 Tax=Sebastes umbrosus TaxID=72105 RepID=UPI0018A06949|nr:transmembrane and death domain protein 1-like isoform X1 [Sebastes umbrosus]